MSCSARDAVGPERARSSDPQIVPPEVDSVNEWFWVWLALVVIFTVAEIIEGGGFVGPWAVGAAVAALFELLSLPIEAQWIAFIGVSSVLVVAWRRTFHPIQRAAHAATEPEEDS